MRNEVCDSSKNISKCPTNTDVYMKPLLVDISVGNRFIPYLDIP
jgi:hypothetical protein